MDTVFVTGANSLLGTNLVLMLLEQGFTVIALVRRKNSFINPGLKNLNLIEGDLLESKKLIERIHPCKYVVHIAANTSQSLLSLDDYYQINVKGAENIINACIHNDVEKLIYIGTANTYGYGNISDPGNENMKMKSPFTKSLYAMSKKQAQDIVDNAVINTKLNITTISPTFMLGPFDTKPSSGRIILMALNKRLILCPSGGKNFVHVTDVAESIIRAFELKQSGLKFILANENISYKDFFRKVVLLNNQKTILIPIPDFLLLLLGLVGELFRFLKIKTEISLVNMKALTVNNYYSNDYVKQELNIEFTPIDNAIIDTLEYFNQNSTLK